MPRKSIKFLSISAYVWFGKWNSTYQVSISAVKKIPNKIGVSAIISEKDQITRIIYSMCFL